MQCSGHCCSASSGGSEQAAAMLLWIYDNLNDVVDVLTKSIDRRSPGAEESGDAAHDAVANKATDAVIRTIDYLTIRLETAKKQKWSNSDNLKAYAGLIEAFSEWAGLGPVPDAAADNITVEWYRCYGSTESSNRMCVPLEITMTRRIPSVAYDYTPASSMEEASILRSPPRWDYDEDVSRVHFFPMLEPFSFADVLRETARFKRFVVPDLRTIVCTDSRGIWACRDILRDAGIDLIFFGGGVTCEGGIERSGSKRIWTAEPTYFLVAR